MLPFNPRKHRKWLYEAGLPQVVPRKLAESTYLDFKRTYSTADPKYADTLRIDAGALATSGDGYLVIGVDESSDRRGIADAVRGLPSDEAERLAASIRDTLRVHIDPPLKLDAPRLVPVGPDRAVIIVHVKGQPRYPVTIDVGKDGGSISYVREGPHNIRLSPQDTRLRRRELAIRRFGPLSALASLVLVALVITVATLYKAQHDSQSQRQLTESERTALLDLLRRYPGRSVSIQTILGDQESALYAEQFVAVFRQANWDVIWGPAVGVDGVGIRLEGGEADPSSDKCIARFSSTVYVLGYALGQVFDGGLLCNPAISSDRPALVIGRNPASPAAQQFLKVHPSDSEILLPLSKIPAPSP